MGGVQYTTCTASFNGNVVQPDLRIESGSVTDTNEPGVRRTLSLELTPVPGVADSLRFFGTTLRPVCVLRYPDGVTESVPMGVFDIDSVSQKYGSNGSISVQASDKWGRVQRSRFLVPQPSDPGVRVTEMIRRLILQGLGTSEPVFITASSTATVGALVWDTDRDKAINELAESIGAWVYFDRNGLCTIADLPAASGRTSSWVVDAGAAGVLLEADRSRDRVKTYNVVVVNSEKVDGSALFDPVIVWDDLAESPTYAGTNPQTAPATAGPFGIVPYFFTSPLLQTTGQAQGAGRAILNRVVGLNSQLSLSSIANRALDSFDVVDVLLPQERYDMPRPVERHIVDKVVHPLTPDGSQRLETRATRPDTV